MSLAGAAFGQSTTGAIFGQVPNGAGQTVKIQSTSGLTREVQVDASGRYSASSLPVGSYTVTLLNGGQPVDSRDNVFLRVGGGIEVDLGAAPANAQDLDAISVSASALPSIDVTSVDSRTVITSQDLARLPLNRSAESIALLAPGTVAGSGYFNNAVSFGGAGVSENAYYINGYNTTNPLNATGGVGLPYGAIDQQQVLTGGYSAKYGRSDGGVINQVGKRGTNEWHFGAQVQWSPKYLAADPSYVYFPNQQLPAGYTYQDDTLPGTLYRARKGDGSWETTYSAYVGGPLIKDKLFIFLAAEANKEEGKSTSSIQSSNPNNLYYQYSRPKFYGKLDWNINDNNILELTAIDNKDEYAGQLYRYNYDNAQTGNFFGNDTSTKMSSRYYIGKYTSYITDDLTFSAQYGVSKNEDYSAVPGASDQPYLYASYNQNPAFTGGTPIRNSQTALYAKDPNAKNKTRGLRADLEYRLGDHTLSAGIDNMYYASSNEGQGMTGPGYAWIYGKTNSPNEALDPNQGVGAPGGDGYYVDRYILDNITSMSVTQKAYYVEDSWQVSNNVVLNLGLRDDEFTNYNNQGKAYVDNKNQWAPRLGVSWDVFGDSSLKVYGNLGRYYLALPASVAIRGASASTFTDEYFTYSGIDASGNPTGLTSIGPGPVSSNNEYGIAPDPQTVAATNLKSQYQDEVMVGFDKALGSEWVAGAKATYRQLQTAIDDVCDIQRLADKADASGIDSSTLDFRGCYIFNPGETNTFKVNYADGSGSELIRMSKEDWGFSEGAKRKYYALDLYLEHPFDGKWQARVDYTFSRSYGNTEGQVKSDIGQDDVSKTQDWDAASLMENSYGLLANDRRHQLKIRGSYQLNPEWMFSGAVRVQSGSPKSCLGYYGTDESNPVSYGSNYHWCAGSPSAPGAAGTNPWTKKLDLGVEYRPSFADHKLAFGLDVFNVLNETKALQSDTTFEEAPYTVSNTYNQGIFFESPRYARLSVSYDF
ncbi:TonB-dependent receptor [Dyella sp.]|uniref:TonB-dependent receptor n=1 Tax=Dyella sp. TaxID=1869338 RepID=UPI0039C8BD91